MTNRQPSSLAEIYTEYVRLRQDGWSTESVVKALKAAVDQLSKRDREQLNQLVVTWENRRSQPAPTPQPPPASPPSNYNYATSTELPPKKSIIRPISPRPRPAEPREKEPFGSAAPEGRVFCPKCGKPNLQTDSYCYSCGHALQLVNPGATRELKVPDPRQPEARETWGAAYFGRTSRIVLIVRGTPKPIEIKQEGQTTIGRTSGDSAIRPDIDLSQFDAEDLGVSRLHAAFQRDENTVQIVDLSSRNFTFVNGQRIYPREVRVLRDGDEIRLGRLSLRVSFIHAG